MKLKIFRYNKGMESPRYDTFQIELSPGLTILSALFKVQEQYDDSLAFRYSCRGAVCGTCAVLINRVPRLACRTQLEALVSKKLDISLSRIPFAGFTEPWDSQQEIIIEPLPHFPVVRDLIVDMSSFFDRYRELGPVFRPEGPDPEKERLMDPKAVKELNRYTPCILCAACYAACPVNGKNPRYAGPAALAKLYRFHIDPRERSGPSRLLTADNPDGWWGCQFYSNCRKVCPKDVPPDIAIGSARHEITKMKDKNNVQNLNGGKS
jgi:succinate dehydrogenase / fumarate reductase iron-sulfur subunit